MRIDHVWQNIGSFITNAKTKFDVNIANIKVKTGQIFQQFTIERVKNFAQPYAKRLKRVEIIALVTLPSVCFVFWGTIPTAYATSALTSQIVANVVSRENTNRVNGTTINITKVP